MDAVTIGLLSVLGLVILVSVGVHIGVALIVAGLAGMWAITGTPDIGYRLLATTFFSAVRDYSFGVLPLFVLMGNLVAVSGMSKEIFDAAAALVKRFTGGLAMATVAANAVFAAATGVSVASAAVFTQIALKPMIDNGYDKRFALGTICGSSILGMLIPPSVLMIIYGILAEQGIGRLFVAGIGPGLLLTLVYLAGTAIAGRVRPHLVGKGASARAAASALSAADLFVRPLALFCLIALVLGGIWTGLFTPTEAGGVGAAGALAIALAKRQLNGGKLWQVLLDTGATATSILFLLIAAQVYARMLALSGTVQWFNDLILGMGLPPMGVIVGFVLVLFVLGFFLDSTSILLIAMPVMVPIVSALGYDLIWFGIIAIFAVEMGLLTPPFGMVVYAVRATLGDESDVTLEDIFIGSVPFLVMMAVTLVPLLLFPGISTWLPSRM